MGGGVGQAGGGDTSGAMGGVSENCLDLRGLELCGHKNPFSRQGRGGLGGRCHSHLCWNPHLLASCRRDLWWGLGQQWALWGNAGAAGEQGMGRA